METETDLKAGPAMGRLLPDRVGVAPPPPPFRSTRVSRKGVHSMETETDLKAGPRFRSAH